MLGRDQQPLGHSARLLSTAPGGLNLSCPSPPGEVCPGTTHFSSHPALGAGGRRKGVNVGAQEWGTGTHIPLRAVMCLSLLQAPRLQHHL